MTVSNEEIKSIASETIKAEKKTLWVPISATFLLTLAGWAYSAGSLSNQVGRNIDDISEIKREASKVPVLQNSIENIQKDITEVKKDQKEINRGQNMILQKLERLEEKISNGR